MLLIVPQVLIFATIKTVEHVLAPRSLLGFLSNALDMLALLFGWGGLAAIVTIAVLAGLGFSERWRPFAASFVLLTNVYTAVRVLIWAQFSSAGDFAFFLLPSAIAASLSIWLIRRGTWSFRRQSGLVPQ